MVNDIMPFGQGEYPLYDPAIHRILKYVDVIPSLFIELISKFLRYVELGE